MGRGDVGGGSVVFSTKKSESGKQQKHNIKVTLSSDLGCISDICSVCI